MFSVRVPVAILTEDTTKVIQLPNPFSATESKVGNILNDANEKQRDVSLSVDQSLQQHLFCKEREDKAWNFQGTTTCRVILRPSQELRNLGNNARQRLEKERMNRREIQRLETVPDAVGATPRKTSSFNLQRSAQSPRKGPSLASTSNKRKQTASLTQLPMKRTKQSTKGWCPLVDHLELPEGESASSMVRLHGLPLACTIEHIRRFCVGLQPQSVSVLLPNRVAMKALDSRGPFPKALDIVEHKFVRAIVTFPSSTAARLASERSGETMKLTAGNSEKEYTIGVSVVPEPLARHLTHLEVPLTPGVELSKHLDTDMVPSLDPMVRIVLWSVAATSHPGLLLDSDIKAANILLPSTLQEYAGKDLDKTYSEMAAYYNELARIQDSMIHSRLYPNVDWKESRSVSETDARVRLTTAASKALHGVLGHIEMHLYQIRVSHESSEKSDSGRLRGETVGGDSLSDGLEDDFEF
eukprot:Nitzschia sp. Nitz4//scaffold20_size174350//81176//82656//NITZ4_002103-RA/size174350-snap-gene-0.243-mRNA-1//-1//CDS//3329541812//4911//frame0